MKPIIVCDVECYKNYFLVSFYNPENGNIRRFESRNGSSVDTLTIRKILKKFTVIGFNFLRYDILMITALINGYKDLKAISDDIILNKVLPWQFENKYAAIQNHDIIDLIEVAIGMGSLKIYGGRLHSAKLQDLPYEPDTELTEEQMNNVADYCDNDLRTTYDLYKELQPQIELREKLSVVYGIDLRSKSDAQIAEAVFKSILNPPKTSKDEIGVPFFYTAPDYLKQAMPDLVKVIENIRFEPREDGYLPTPDELANKMVKIGDMVYAMGIGGLHSTEKNLTIYCGDDEILEDRDVASYYPSMIINNSYCRRKIFPSFITEFKKIYDQRIKAKHSDDKVTSDVMKIILNGSYGKFGSKYSVLYCPRSMIQVTLTGQLTLLMLIEALDKAGIKTVSANTDGIVLHYKKDKAEIANGIIREWEKITGLIMEATPYKAIHNRDVNSYINVKMDNKTKTKGAYALDSLAKNPHGDISVIAVVEYLVNGTPLEQTIRSCDDIRKFVFLRKVEGGAMKNDEFLGKVVRWYYSTQDNTPIVYAKNGNKVSESDGGKPVMSLPDTLPDDIDYQRYIDMAKETLTLIGV